MTHARRADDPSQLVAPPPDDEWIVAATRAAVPIEELSDLEPPEPLERVLLACARLAPGAVFCAHMPRTPTMLFPHLEARGLEWRVAARRDGTALLWIRGPAT